MPDAGPVRMWGVWDDGSDKLSPWARFVAIEKDPFTADAIRDISPNTRTVIPGTFTPDAAEEVGDETD